MEIGSKPDDRDLTLEKIKLLCLAQVQLDKGMPILLPLEPGWDSIIQGNDE